MVKLRTLPRPTHYTTALDEATGCPAAVRGENYAPDEIAGPLPENWHPDFYDWHPRHDPKGAWVELTEDRRGALWETVKADREAEMAGNATATVAGRKLTFQADAKSLIWLNIQWAASQADPAWPGVDWTTAGNATVHLDREGLAAVIVAIAAHGRVVHAASQDARARINDTSAPLLRSLDEVKASIDLKTTRQERLNER